MNLDTLEAAARRATGGASWTVREVGVSYDGDRLDEPEFMVDDENGMWVADCGESEFDAEHISNCAPATILALIAELRSLRAVAEAAEAWRDQTQGMTTLNASERSLAAAIDAHRERSTK